MKKLHGKMPVAQGCQGIVKHCLKQVRASEAGVMSGGEPESVHDMRVGLRRLATAIDLFDSIFSLPLSLQADLDWIRKELGMARDWEVLVHDTLPSALKANPGQPDLELLLQHSRSIALSKRKKAAFAVGSARYRQFVRAMDDWSERIGSDSLLLPAARKRAASTLEDFAFAALSRRHRKLRRRMRNLHPEDAAERHRVRIAAKKARYAAEFFRSLYSRTLMRPYLSALIAMQEVIGELNDLSVTRELMLQLESGHAEVTYAAGFLQGYLNAGVPDRLRSLEKRIGSLQKLNLPGAD